MVCHTADEIDRCRGSKYIQAISEKAVYKEIEATLNKGRVVLVTGTPCYANAVQKYCVAKGLNTNNLITCEILCHGVGSPGIWNTFITYKTKGKPVEYLTFKDKKNGWMNPRCLLFMDEKEISIREYSWLYFSNAIMRPSCYNCKFASIDRKADFTIGDFWAVQRKHKDIYNPRGTSFITVNSDKAENLFKKIQNNIVYKEVLVEDILQHNMQKPTDKPTKRDLIMKDYRLMKPNNYFRKWYLIFLINKVLKRIKH